MTYKSTDTYKHDFIYSGILANEPSQTVSIFFYISLFINLEKIFEANRNKREALHFFSEKSGLSRFQTIYRSLHFFPCHQVKQFWKVIYYPDDHIDYFNNR